jgi:hypothetical protein
MGNEKVEQSLTLLSFMFNPYDWSLGVIVSPYIIAGVIVSVLAILGIRWYFKGRLLSTDWEIDEAEIGIGDQKIKLKPNYTDRQIGYAIWVELSTRKIGLEIDFDNDVIAEIYDSWYNYFSVTRELIKGISISQIENTSTRAIVNLSIDVLNDGLRPHLTKWQARFRWWYDRQLKKHGGDDNSVLDLQEIQKSFPAYSELKTDMERVNNSLISYRNKMKQLVFRE